MKSFRQKEMIEILFREGMITTADAAKHFGVSTETIRRDLDQLEKQGVLKKNYGGAELIKPCRDSKATIAARAASYVSNNSTIALDAGTSVLELCPYLKEKENLIIISSDVHASAELSTSGNNKVYIMGGFLAPDGTSSGTFAKEFLNNIAGIDVFMFSADGADWEVGLSTNEAGVNNLKKLYLKKAQKRIAMIDHSKFFKKAFYKMCPFSDIDVLITDSLTPPDIIDNIRRRGTKVDVVTAF